MDKKEIEDFVLQEINLNNYEKINNNLYLTKYQKEVLNNYHIPYEKCNNSKELLFLLSDIIDDEEYDELENVAREIAEFDYYNN